MRVVSGIFRGKKLYTSKNNKIRPTSDKTKESLFNMLQEKIYESRFLDLFSGSGAISIEAISRGAKNATLVENSRESISIINKNISNIKTKFEIEKFKIVKSDVEKFLKNEKNNYDIIFLDPPYNYSKNNALLYIIFKNKILNKDGIIVFETDKNYIFLGNDDYFDIVKTKKYSISKLTFFTYKEGRRNV